MDWDKLRDQWRGTAPAAPLMAVDELRTLDASLWKKVRRRDLAETVAAVIVALFFALVALGALADDAWLEAAFGLLVAAWGVALPFQLRRARRQASPDGHHASMRDYLHRQRDAALAQARLLERVWLWYLAPPAVGLAGLTLARDGFSPGALGYVAAMLVLYAGIFWLNRYTARTQFRSHAARLQRQIDALQADDT